MIMSINTCAVIRSIFAVLATVVMLFMTEKVDTTTWVIWAFGLTLMAISGCAREIRDEIRERNAR